MTQIPDVSGIPNFIEENVLKYVLKNVTNFGIPELDDPPASYLTNLNI